jgi:hypothetical protein
MKTVEKVKKEIAIVRKNIENGLLDKSSKKRLEFLTKCQLYLESELDEIYLGTEKNRLTQLLKDIDDEYQRTFPKGGNFHRKQFDKVCDVDRLKEQLRNIEYLLED